MEIWIEVRWGGVRLVGGKGVSAIDWSISAIFRVTGLAVMAVWGPGIGVASQVLHVNRRANQSVTALLRESFLYDNCPRNEVVKCSLVLVEK